MASWETHPTLITARNGPKSRTESSYVLINIIIVASGSLFTIFRPIAWAIALVYCSATAPGHLFPIIDSVVRICFLRLSGKSYYVADSSRVRWLVAIRSGKSAWYSRESKDGELLPQEEGTQICIDDCKRFVVREIVASKGNLALRDVFPGQITVFSTLVQL
jgi:hypothetical protein